MQTAAANVFGAYERRVQVGGTEVDVHVRLCRGVACAAEHRVGIVDTRDMEAVACERDGVVAGAAPEVDDAGVRRQMRGERVHDVVDVLQARGRRAHRVPPAAVRVPQELEESVARAHR